jgi:hypothetical protein
VLEETLPLLPPLQLTSDVTLAVTFKTVGCVIVADAVAVQPLLSLRVMVYVPMERPVSVEFVPPPVHEYV